MQYPSREADILRLANDIAAGLATHTEVFPAPPHGPDEIRETLSAVTTAHEAAVVAAAQARQRTATKDEAFAKLVDLMKTDLRNAEGATRNDHGQLQLLGWGAPQARTATGLPDPLCMNAANPTSTVRTVDRILTPR